MRSLSIGLQRRVTLYMAVGLAGLFGVFAYVAIDSANRSSDVILEERVTLARLLASNVDSLLSAGGNLVDEAAENASLTVFDSTDLGPTTDALAIALDELTQLTDGTSIGIYDGNGELVAGHRSDRLSDPLNAVSREDDSFDYRVVHDATGKTVVSVTSTIPNRTGSDGLLVAQFRPGPGILRIASDSGLDATQYRVELIASGGEVVASSEPGDRDLTSRHSGILSGLVDEQETRVVEHVLVDTGTDPVNHVVAFAPLATGSLGIVLEQPEDIALALPNDLRRRILLISGIGLVIGLAVAWFTSRQVVRPLEVLTMNARSIAGGRLDQPIVPSGQDEIRRLGESFESMRARLSDSVNELERWSAELESRVRERTNELEARSRERDMLLNKVITAQEDERTRVARDLHDQVGQSLTALVMQLGAAESLLAKEESSAKADVQRTREGLSETIDEVRRLMSDLRPSVLDDMGLASAVRWYAEQKLSDAGVQVEISVDLVEREVSTATEISVFRIFQEAINNVVKHADAGTVLVSLSNADNQLECTVADDGIGFDPQANVPGSEQGWAVGLIGMRERANLLHGTIEIQSSPGNGTKVSFQIPIERKQ